MTPSAEIASIKCVREIRNTSVRIEIHATYMTVVYVSARIHQRLTLALLLTSRTPPTIAMTLGTVAASTIARIRKTGAKGCEITNANSTTIPQTVRETVALSVRRTTAAIITTSSVVE